MLATLSRVSLGHRNPFATAPRWETLAALGVLLVAAFLFFARLGERGVVSEELRWAEVAREMRLSGDYLHPTINGRTYYDKPVGSYWLIVAASYLTGEVNETAARLPAAVAGWFGVLLVMALGRRLYDERTAVLAGAVLASSFGFAFYARRATADIETVTGVLAAVWLFARHHERPGAWVVALWLLMAATSLTKGLLGFALPGAVFVMYGVWATLLRSSTDRSIIAANRWFFNRWTLLAAPLGIALYFLPFMLSLSETGAADGLQMVWRENIRRFFAPHNHKGPVYLYVGVIFLLAAPWSAFLPAALLPRRSDATDGDRLARAFFWTVFIFFTLSASRRSYYLLPVLPAVALLVGRVLTATSEELRPMARRLRSAGYAIIFAGVALAGLGLLAPADVLPTPYNQLPPLPARWFIAVGWFIGLTALATRRRPIVVATLAAFVGIGYVQLIALPAAEEYRTRKDFAEEVAARTADDPGRLALFHARDVVFDLRRPAPIPEYQTAEELNAAVRSGRVRWVIVRRRYLVQLHLATVTLTEEAAQPWEGRNQLGDKMVLLDTERQKP